MDEQSAKKFLQENQPLPDDNQLSSRKVEKLWQVIKYYSRNPDEYFLDNIWNTLGFIDGFGVYQRIDEALRQFSDDAVVKSLVQGFKSGRTPAVFWCCHFSAEWPDTRLLPHIERAIRYDSVDIRTVAVMALESIGGEDALNILQDARINEKDTVLKELISEIIQDDPRENV